MLIKYIKYYKYLIIAFTLIAATTFLSTNTTDFSLENITAMKLFILFLVGIVAASTMVIPGISGSLVLMMIGFYEPIVETVSNLKTLYSLESKDKLSIHSHCVYLKTLFQTFIKCCG